MAANTRKTHKSYSSSASKEEFESDASDGSEDNFVPKNLKEIKRTISNLPTNVVVSAPAGVSDFSGELLLKPDHAQRPIYVTSENEILLEAFSAMYAQAYDFLITIAEPVSRPEFVHKYVLTQNSLYSAGNYIFCFIYFYCYKFNFL